MAPSLNKFYKSITSAKEERDVEVAYAPAFQKAFKGVSIAHHFKCDKCQDGYLIVKEGKIEPSLGCTNFKADKTGCDGFMTREFYVKNVSTG